MPHRLLSVCAIAAVAAVGVLAMRSAAQTGAAGSEWRHYGGTPGSTKHSPLDLINRDNASQLRIAWRWSSPDNAISKANDLQPGAYEDTPLMANGMLYTITSLGVLAAIDPGTGAHDLAVRPGELEGGTADQPRLRPPRPRVLDRRQEPIVMLAGTHDAYLISVDAKTGKPDPTFGTDGRVDLTERLAYVRARPELRDQLGAGRRPQRRHRRREHLRRPAEQGGACAAT